ncbi:MAG: hypothetical protein PHU14_00215 [Methylovulum sp.]|nr:hypothetical protein [Methylovulum sp.]
MRTKKNRRYPDMQVMRRRTNLVCMAIQTLSGLGIDVMSIDLSAGKTVIEVAQCPSVRALHGVSVGQAHDGLTRSVRKSATICGCDIFWSEAV